jgi:hypothetical protein
MSFTGKVYSVYNHSIQKLMAMPFGPSWEDPLPSPPGETLSGLRVPPRSSCKLGRSWDQPQSGPFPARTTTDSNTQAEGGPCPADGSLSPSMWLDARECTIRVDRVGPRSCLLPLPSICLHPALWPTFISHWTPCRSQHPSASLLLLSLSDWSVHGEEAAGLGTAKCCVRMILE